MKKWLLSWLLIGLVACRPVSEQWDVLPPQAIATAVQDLTMVMVEDIFSPPLASRTYAYSCIAAWEAFALCDTSATSISGMLNGFAADMPTPPVAADPHLSAILAFYGMGQQLVFSEQLLEQYREEFYSRWQPLYSHAVWEASERLARETVAALTPWRDADGYRQTRGLTRYTLEQSPGYWTPTPPGYIDAIEPYWNRIRPFTLDSAAQFMPPPPPPYSTDTGSAFYKTMAEVYTITSGLTPEQQLIANFWDCNPFFLEVQGHFNYSSKKISPGAHWMGITSIACRQANMDFAHTLLTHTQVAIALADAFISCWDEKYRSEYIRPETAIQQQLDKTWTPQLQTPPFPEYTSGHSVISTAAATILTAVLGDVAFVDSVEVPFGLPPRSFASFRQAADEAAISRLYGGIHFRPAIEEGQRQGLQVGNWVSDRLQVQSYNKLTDSTSFHP